jgi:hypothetical protein
MREPATLKAALRLFLQRIRDHYGDPRAVQKHRSRKHTYLCRCPAHDDDNPSLTVTVRNGRLVFHCLATSRCGYQDILKALDFKPRWCFAAVTVKRLAKAKKLPAEFLTGLGCTDWQRRVLIPYYDARKDQVCVRRRVALVKRKGQGPTTYQQTGKPLHLYGEWPDPLIPRSDEVVFVEGETDTWTLWFHGIPAYGIPGATAAKVIRKRHLKGINRAYVWREHDEAGAGFVAGVLRRLRRLKFRGDVLVLNHEKYKDPSDLHLGEQDFRAAWQAVVARAQKAEDNREEPGGDLPVIYTSNRQLVDIRREALAALQRANQPPRHFHRAGCVCRLWVDPETNRPAFEPLSAKALRGVLAEVAVWRKKTRDGSANVIVPDFVAEDLTSLRHTVLPPVRTIVEAPYFTTSGRLVAEPGYDPESLYYLHAPTLKLPPIPQQPTAEDIERASRLLLDDLLVDFPFINDSGRANTLAFLLLGFMRRLINGPTPLHLIDAPAPGTGKDLLAGCSTILTTGRAASTKSESHGEEEWKKNLTSILGEGPSYVYFENINYALSSATLTKCITGRVHRDRVLGRNDKEREMPVDCVWIATGNNVRSSGELARRMVKIRLDARMEAPERRTGFKHPLPGWVYDNRPGLIAACLTLIQAWVARGMPRGKPACMLGSFEEWCSVMAGVLEVIGVNGFLASLRDDMAETNSSVQEWREFVVQWLRTYQTGSVTATELCELCSTNNLLGGTVFQDVPDRKDVHRRKTKLGIALGNNKDRVIDGWQIKVELDAHTKGSRYHLEYVRGEGG